MPCSRPRSANWKSRKFWSPVTTSRFFKGDQAGMEREIARAPRRACGGLDVRTIRPWCSRVPVKCGRRGPCGSAQSHWRSRPAIAKEPRSTKPRRRCAKRISGMRQRQRSALAALELAKGRDVEYAAAFALALSGESSAISKARRRPGETIPGGYPGAIRVSSHAARSFRTRSSGAVGRGRATCNGRFLTISRCRAQRSLPSSEASIPRIYAARRTLQQDGAERPRSEFQKVLDHRGIVFADPIGALAHLQLGRAYVVSGDMAKAKNAYQDFLTLWKDADADIPVLKQAKAEYAKLR